MKTPSRIDILIANGIEMTVCEASATRKFSKGKDFMIVEINRVPSLQEMESRFGKMVKGLYWD